MAVGFRHIGVAGWAFGVVLVVALAVSTACSDQATVTPATSTPSPAVSVPAGVSTATEAPDTNALSVTLKDFSLTSGSPTVKSGKLTITGINQGAVVHEFVILKTDLAPTDLPLTADGLVDEEKLQSPGEIEDIEPGATAKGEFTLEPGKYVLICNLPGHYGQGMRAALTAE